jgi:hypothetical protein
MNRKKKYNKGIRIIEGLIKRTENTLKRSVYHVKLQGSSPIEPLKNYCLKNIEALNKLNKKALDIPDVVHDYARKRMFEIYFALQEYRGAERQIEVNREVSLDDILGLLDAEAVESYAAEARTGGLGFSSLSGATLYTGSVKSHNEYWKPPNKRGKLSGSGVGSYGIMPHRRKETIEDWREEMSKQKKEIMDEVYRLQ